MAYNKYTHIYHLNWLMITCSLLGDHQRNHMTTSAQGLYVYNHLSFKLYLIKCV